ncbi:hypothetical protein AAMO2058_001732500, partial [Amorphochlora amoebiformis]
MGMCYLGERGGKRMGRGKKKRMTELQDRDLFSSKELAGLFDDKGGLKEFSPPPLKDGASENPPNHSTAITKPLPEPQSFAPLERVNLWMLKQKAPNVDPMMGLASTAEHDYSVRTAGSYVLRQMEARLREEKVAAGRRRIEPLLAFLRPPPEKFQENTSRQMKPGAANLPELPPIPGLPPPPVGMGTVSTLRLRQEGHQTFRKKDEVNPVGMRPLIEPITGPKQRGKQRLGVNPYECHGVDLSEPISGEEEIELDDRAIAAGLTPRFVALCLRKMEWAEEQFGDSLALIDETPIPPQDMPPDLFNKLSECYDFLRDRFHGFKEEREERETRRKKSEMFAKRAEWIHKNIHTGEEDTIRSVYTLSYP